ncbi:MAG: alcohol dehydrogenase catalytic domain-containing protein [Desulfobacteraceae bacterium]|nr:alcohol dehydrogenase catalytic domain-containing protein [Desulfobacteraceae bacterium]
MKAVWFENREITLTALPFPEPGGNEALVKVLMAGICATDTEIYQGYAEFSGIAGHEFVGEVRKAPADTDLVGKRVVADINCGCGKCAWCRCGDPRHCESRTVLGIRGRNGAFAEYIAVPVQNLHAVPEGVDTLRAVFAEPLAAALEITQQAHITNSMRILVLGDGKLGLLCALGLKHFSSRVTIAGRHAEKLAIAGNQGIDTLAVPSGETSASAFREFRRFDMVVEATGSPTGIREALELVRPEGTVIVKTTSHSPTQIDLSAVAVNEIHLLGSRCGDIDLALQFLANNRIDVLPLAEKIYPLSRFTEAFAHAAARGSLKVLIDPTQSGESVSFSVE